MPFSVDHDYHIHSYRSLCSEDPEQNTQRILQYAVDNGFSNICLTDHFWDERCGVPDDLFYRVQNYPYLATLTPLPQVPGVRFHFGCETDMDKNGVLGLSRERMDAFEFIIIPTTHLHMLNVTISERDWGSLARRRAIYIERLNKVLDMDLPFQKVGIAHLTCSLAAPLSPKDHIKLFSDISDDEYKRLFSRIAEKGCGVELNFNDLAYDADELEIILRPYRLAKDMGCRFYFGSDAHHPHELDSAKKQFDRQVKLLGLEEKDRFNPFR